MEKIAILMPPIDQRRIEMLTLKATGIPNANIVQTLAEKYHVKPKAIYEDWRKRGKWAPRLVELDDSEGLIADLVIFLKWLQKRAVKEILDGDNSSSRIGGVKIAAEIARFIFEIAKDTGKIKIVPKQMEVEQTVDVCWSDGDDDSAEDTIKVQDAPGAEAVPQEQGKE